jgi:hypothetical protein
MEKSHTDQVVTLLSTSMGPPLIRRPPFAVLALGTLTAGTMIKGSPCVPAIAYREFCGRGPSLGRGLVVALAPGTRRGEGEKRTNAALASQSSANRTLFPFMPRGTDTDQCDNRRKNFPLTDDRFL